MLDSIKLRNQIRKDRPLDRQPRPKRSKFRLVLALTMLILLAGGIFAGSKLVIFAQKILEGSGTEFSFKRLFLAGDKQLVGEEQGEIRVLLLGIGGQDHDGGTLTDTIILATLRLAKFEDEETRVNLISIPRDLVVNIPGYDYRKINTAYAFGELNDRKQGPALAKLAVEELLDTSIPYYAVVDFQAFQKIIDDLGGVQINVETGFTDAMFPDGKYGYLPALSFAAGEQKMDGQRALQYVRSRHGNNDQGTDFARSKRQQQLLRAVKDKISRPNIFTNINLLSRILENLAEHIRTNIAPHEIKRFYELTKKIDNQNFSSFAVDVESGLLCNQIVEETGAYVLLPCAGLGNYESVRNLVKNQFVLGDLSEEKPIIEVQSAGGAYFASMQVKELLALPTLEITLSQLKSSAVYEESVIYDNTRGSKPRTLKYLKDRLSTPLASSPFPFPTVAEGADFVIIVTGAPKQ